MASIIRNAALTLTFSLALVAACGGDADVENDTGEGGDDGTSSTGDTSSSGSGDTSSSTGASGQQNACGPDSVNQDDPCEMCIATQCTAEALACCQAPGCLDVVLCAAEKGCGGVDCYTPDKCQEEIDAAGIDVASNEATALGECALENCAMECGQEEAGTGGAGGSQ
jgi:hypothetical protein